MTTAEASVQWYRLPDPDELMWICNDTRSKGHFKKTLHVPAIEVRNNKLLPFLHFLVFMICNERLGRIVEELKAAHGIHESTIYVWQKLYHKAVSKLVTKKSVNKIGGNNERCAVDETAVGKVGKMVGKPPQRVGAFQRGALRNDKSFRAADGTHTNDVESEVARFKLWSRGKWAKVRTVNSRCSNKKQATLKSHVNEYVAQTKLGTNMRLSMSQVMYGFRLLDTGRKYPGVDLCS